MRQLIILSVAGSRSPSRTCSGFQAARLNNKYWPIRREPFADAGLLHSKAHNGLARSGLDKLRFRRLGKSVPGLSRNQVPLRARITPVSPAGTDAGGLRTTISVGHPFGHTNKM